MKLSKMSKEEIEMLGYDDIAVLVLEENGKKMKIIDTFRKICEVLGLSNSEFEDKVADFYEMISTNKLFTVLPDGYCDLKTRHNTKIVIDDEEDDVVIDEVEEDEVEEETEDEDIFYDEEADDDPVDDELQDFVVVDSEEENNA